MTDAIAVDQLRAFVTRIENLETEKADLAGHIRDVFTEAKSAGFDTKAMRQVIRLRKLEANERDEQEHMLELYAAALGLRPALEDAA